MKTASPGGRCDDRQASSCDRYLLDGARPSVEDDAVQPTG